MENAFAVKDAEAVKDRFVILLDDVITTGATMEEAERVAGNVAIIDHGKIVARDTPQGIIASSGTASLEDAFIKLTGRKIREEEAGAADHMRKMRRMWRGNRR